MGVTAPRPRVDDFDYDLPVDAIAQVPAEPRDASRLLVVDRSRPGEVRHLVFRDIGELLDAGDAFVWPAEAFAPVAAELEQVFEGLGLLRAPLALTA